MTTIYISKALQETNSLELSIKLINNGSCEGMEPEGGTEFTPAMLAGQYAQSAADENGYGVDRGSIEAHLDHLIEFGAVFNYADAVDHALAIAAALR